MADDESIFDPTMKKKKKSKKPVDMSALEGGEDQDKENSETVEDKTLAGENVDDFSGLKKKKKKKKGLNLDELGSALPDEEEKDEDNLGSPDGPDAENAEADDLEGDLGDLDLTKKKKKKKKITFEDMVNEDDDGDGLGVPDDSAVDRDNDEESSQAATWFGVDRDYTYDELLQRVFNIIKEKNPDIDSGAKKRLVMRPPQVLRIGTKKTLFANFFEICRSLHRQAKHLQAFLLAELGTNGSVDANNQLIIKGRFQQKQIENVLRRYIKEYVACQTCRSPDTMLQKETRLFFLQCETCGSRRSVVSIKSGFQAVTSKRAAMRAKTA